MIFINLLKKSFIGLITGLMKDLVGYLNEYKDNMSIFLFIVHYQEVIILNCLIN